MFFYDWWNNGKVRQTTKILLEQCWWIFAKLLVASLMIYFLRNCMLMALVKTVLRFSTPISRDVSKQNVKINNTYTIFIKELLSGMLQGSILGPILFNIFINNLFLWLSTTDLHNFADDNTISAFSKDLQELIKILEEVSECAIKWFTNNCFIYSNFNSCPLVWHFCSHRLINKIENIQKCILRFVLNDYTSNYETMLNKSSKCTMEVRQIRVLPLEVFRSVNKLNPVYIQSFFETNVNSKRYKDDLKVPIRNSVTFGEKGVRVSGPHIWNMLPAELKRETSYEKFKTEVNNWFGPKCNCSACKYVGN